MTVSGTGSGADIAGSGSSWCPIEVVPIDTPSLGDRSYLVSDGRVAFVVDPQRDFDRVFDAARARGVRITHVFETHIHNDYVTGGLALAEATGAAYHVNAEDLVAYARVPVRDGDVVEVSASMRVRVLATPGHTFTHLSYVLESDGEPRAVFTGGSLLYGSTGRPDLLGPAHTETLAHAQHASAQRLARELPDEVAVFPTHGFGSFCSATQAEGQSSTIGREQQVNLVLTLPEREYVGSLLAGLDDFPAYYAHMGRMNAAGPGAPDLSAPRPVEAGELRRRAQAGDLRPRTEFAAGHVAGTFNFGLDGGFATYLGWLIPWGTPLTLLGRTPEEIARAQRELVRIGIDRLAGAATGTPYEWAGSERLRGFPTADFAQLTAVRRHRPVVVLDVRRNLEWAEAHIEGAVHIPLHELLTRIYQVPEGEVWVHCQAGYRAAVAASILDAAGRSVVAVDDRFNRAAAIGLPVVRGNRPGLG